MSLSGFDFLTLSITLPLSSSVMCLVSSTGTLSVGGFNVPWSLVEVL